MPITMKNVISKLDALDGIEDEEYMNLSLYDMNLTGACHIAEALKKEFADDDNITTGVGELTTNGNMVELDCKALAQRLNKIVDIAQKLPTYSFMAAMMADKLDSETNVPAEEDIYAFIMLNHMISALLVGTNTADKSLSELFSQVDFVLIAKSINTDLESLSKAIPGVSPGTLNIDNVHSGYSFFEMLGKKYGFDPTPFKPTAIKQPIKSSLPKF